MPRRLTTAMVFLLWPTVAAAQLQTPGAADDVYREDTRARRMRVQFPLHDRLWLRSAHTSGTEPSFELEVGLSLSLAADFPDEEIWWQLRHDFVRVRFQPGRAANLRLALFNGDYLRHDTSSAILIPRGKHDIRLPAPFDIAVVWQLGELHIDTVEGLRAAQVADVVLLADFLRDEHYRHRFAVGPSGRYGVTRRTASWRHEVVPFAGISTLYAWEAASGRFAFEVRPGLEYGATVDVGDPVSWMWAATGRAELEWVPLAINDLPLSVLGEGSVDHQLRGATTWTIGLGARLGVPLGI